MKSFFTGALIGAALGLVFLTNAVAAEAPTCVTMERMKADALANGIVIHEFKPQYVAAIRYEVQHFKGGIHSEGADKVTVDHIYVMDGGSGATIMVLLVELDCIKGSYVFSVEQMDQIFKQVAKDLKH